MDNKRYNGIDIIKVLAIVFVPFLHYYNNYNFNTFLMKSPINLIEIAIRWISFSCIGLFLMSSGYLLCNKTASKSYYLKSIKFFILYFIALFIFEIYIYGFPSDFFIILLKDYFIFPRYFWYVSFYICFYFLIPYINIIIQKLSNKEYKIFLLTLVLIICIPDFYNAFPAYSGDKIVFLLNPFSSSFPLVYYFMGAYFRKFNPNFSKRKSTFILILTLLFISCVDFTYSKGGTFKFLGGGYGNIVLTIITVCIFDIFYNIKFKNKILSSIFKFSASITFETYLCFQLADKYSYKIMSTITNVSTMPYRYIFIAGSLSFLIAYTLGVLIHLFTVGIKKIFLTEKRTI